MAYFVSIRCEGRGEGRCVYGGDRCWSDDNDDPWVLADDTKRSVMQCMDDLIKEASDGGWKKINGEWMCPNCQKHATKG